MRWWTGGVSTVGTEGKFEGYTGPKMGEVVNRTPFTVNIYTEEKDGDGETTGYLKFTCKHCKGTPADIEIKDGDFFAPEYKLKSRPEDRANRPSPSRRWTNCRPKNCVKGQEANKAL